MPTPTSGTRSQVSANPQVSAVLGSFGVGKCCNPRVCWSGVPKTVTTRGFVRRGLGNFCDLRVCSAGIARLGPTASLRVLSEGGYFARHAFATKMRGIKRVKECGKRRVCARRGLKSVASVRFAAGISPVPSTCRTSLGVFARAGLKNFELCVPQNAFWASVRRRYEKLSRKTAGNEVALRASFPGGRCSRH